MLVFPSVAHVRSMCVVPEGPGVGCVHECETSVVVHVYWIWSAPNDGFRPSRSHEDPVTGTIANHNHPGTAA